MACLYSIGPVALVTHHGLVCEFWLCQEFHLPGWGRAWVRLVSSSHNFGSCLLNFAIWWQVLFYHHVHQELNLGFADYGGNGITFSRQALKFPPPTTPLAPFKKLSNQIASFRIQLKLGILAQTCEWKYIRWWDLAAFVQLLTSSPLFWALHVLRRTPVDEPGS